MAGKKIPPNPNGKLGGAKHQKKVQEVAQEIGNRGLLAKLEYFIRLFSGRARYLDVAGLDAESRSIVELHQVGKQTQKGKPIKREEIVLDEVEEDLGIRPEFHPYNETEEDDANEN